MASKTGLALRLLQWLIRGVQFCCAAIVLGIFAYFLAALHDHNIGSNHSVRAVTGISGAAVLYTLIALMLLLCVAGVVFTSILAILLDLAFMGCFIYVAVVNRRGARSCNGYIDTAWGRGRTQFTGQGGGNFNYMPRYRTACRLQKACFAVSIVAIVFFLLSILMEMLLTRHRRNQKRYAATTNYTSDDRYSRGGIRGSLFSRLPSSVVNRVPSRFRGDAEKTRYDDQLPSHPQHVDGRQSYATEATVVNPDNRYSGNYKPDAVPLNTGTANTGTAYTGTAHTGTAHTGTTRTGTAHTGTTNTNTYGNLNTTANTTNTTTTGTGYGHHTAGTVPPLAPQNAGNYRYGDGVYDQR